MTSSIRGFIDMNSSVTSSSSSGVFRSLSDSPPVHCNVNIDSFSLITKYFGHYERQQVAYESEEFKAGGYKWKLVFYPKGNKKKMVEDHVSAYLQIVGANRFEIGWGVYVDFRFFLLDQTKSVYTIFEDAYTKNKCIHGSKLGVGLDRVISLDEFHDRSNGFIVHDKCVFGAEVFVCKEVRRETIECVSSLLPALTYSHDWEVKDFSILADPIYRSESFSFGGHEWNLEFNCERDGQQSFRTSVVLNLADKEATTVTKVFAEVYSRIRHPFSDKFKWDFRGPVNYCFINGGRGCSWKTTCDTKRDTKKWIRWSNYKCSDDTLRITTSLTLHGITEKPCDSEDESCNSSVNTTIFSDIQNMIQPYYKECLGVVSMAVGLFFLFRKNKTS